LQIGFRNIRFSDDEPHVVVDMSGRFAKHLRGQGVARSLLLELDQKLVQRFPQLMHRLLVKQSIFVKPEACEVLYAWVSAI
jgi:hypothetical protein